MRNREVLVVWDRNWFLRDAARAVSSCESVPALALHDSAYWGPYYFGEDGLVGVRVYLNWDPLDDEAFRDDVGARLPMLKLFGSAAAVDAILVALQKSLVGGRIVRDVIWGDGRRVVVKA